jgi:hypothetical protein
VPLADDVPVMLIVELEVEEVHPVFVLVTDELPDDVPV